jgi:hypothetical protein
MLPAKGYWKQVGRYATVIVMDTNESFLSRIFTALILKPADFLLFGGCGALWRPKEEWQEIDSPLRAAGSLEQSDIEDDLPPIWDSFPRNTPWSNRGDLDPHDFTSRE